MSEDLNSIFHCVFRPDSATIFLPDGGIATAAREKDVHDPKLARMDHGLSMILIAERNPKCSKSYLAVGLGNDFPGLFRSLDIGENIDIFGADVSFIH